MLTMPNVVRKLHNEITPRFKNVTGSYTRITKIPGWRRGDGANIAYIEIRGNLTELNEKEKLRIKYLD